MPLTFIHLSDIHFGQEKGGRLIIHNDVREQLLDDAESILSESRVPVQGMIVTGDLAYSGTPDEYEIAGRFLDSLAQRAGCVKTAVQLIPGNHDIHRPSIS